MVNTAVIEDAPAPTNLAPGPGMEPQSSQRSSTDHARPRLWSVPTVESTRNHIRSAATVATALGAMLAHLMRGAAMVGTGIAAFAAQVVREVPPALRLLGALGLCAILSIVGSITLDNTLGKSCAVVFVPGFAVAFGVVAHRWYRGLDHGPEHSNGVQQAGHPAVDTERCAAFADAKLAFALNALGTDRHQQALVALIQAKTATELSFGPGRGDAGHRFRPRIRDGGGASESS